MNDEVWIKASEAIQIMTGKGESPPQQEAILLAYLRNGDLRARAAKMWVSTCRYTTKAWKSCPDETTGGEIPVGNWRFEKDVEGDRQRFRFKSNQFAVTKRMKPRTRVMMRGVEFSLDDLCKLQPTYFASRSGKRRRGRPVELEKAHAGWRTVLDMALSGELTTDTYRSIEELRDEIRARATLNDRAQLGDNLARDIARFALAAARLREGSDKK